MSLLQLKMLKAVKCVTVLTKAVLFILTVGQVGFTAQAIKENVEALIADLKKAKPATSKGVYVQKVTLSTTMGPGLAIDQASISNCLKIMELQKLLTDFDTLSSVKDLRRNKR
jgi:large subunit ribosomal protein L1